MSSPPPDEDQDSLFGSPPPSPARGRSPSLETLITGEQVNPASDAAAGSKNVGTIALPGSHMSCAELPADLPVSRLSLPLGTAGRGPLNALTSSTPGVPAAVHVSAAASKSSIRSTPSEAPSVAGTVPSTSAPIRKRNRPKGRSSISISPAPPIALPGPNEPTPPNFLRSQSSLLGLAGLVGCVKPTQLHTHATQPSTQPTRSCLPMRGSTPAHPIILDDDQDSPHIGKCTCRGQIPQRLDQLDPEILRSNIVNSLAKEKNIFPVLESLIKLFGGEPCTPSVDPLPQPFSRPYGHNIFSTQSPNAAAFYCSTSVTSIAPHPKRRKLKHVPAGAADWDIPFPFAAGEGPEAYRDNWAQDRARQLVSQLLELVQNATRRAAIKTARSGGKGQTKVPKRRLSGGPSSEMQSEQTISMQANTQESLSYADASLEGTTTGTLSVAPTSTIDSSASHSKDRTSVNPESAVVNAALDVSCDYAAFDEWLSQLEQLMPLEADTPISDSEWDAHAPPASDSSPSDTMSHVLAPGQREALIIPHMIRDEAIDPALLAISQQVVLMPQSHSSTSSTSMSALDDVSFPPVLTHSPRTRLSSLTEAVTEVVTPPPEVSADAVAAHQDPTPGLTTPPLIEKSRLCQPARRASSLSLTEHSTSPRITATRKGKSRAADSIASGMPSVSARFAPNAACASGGTLDKQAVLERAREHRRQLVAKIERAKMEIWETSIENAVLVRLMKDGPSCA